MWDRSPLPHILCVMWLSSERLDKSRGSSGLCQWHKCENADSAAKNRRWTADCRFDHSSKLCVSSCKSPVNFRPVSAAGGPTKTAVAAASPTEHHQLEQLVKSSSFHMVLNAARAYHLHKNQGQFPKNSIFFFQLCSLVNLGWGRVKDKPGIGSNADSKQSGGYMCLSSCFLRAACALLLGWAECMCVCVCVRVHVRVCVSLSVS